jgi:Na+/H+-dicarboxylate symporter
MNHKHAVYLLVFIALGVVAGFAAGLIFGEDMIAIKWVGDLFLNALKMMIIPLIIAAVISGVTSLGDIRKLGRIGGMTIAYYLITTAIAVLIGLVVVNLFQPGVGIDLIALDNHGDKIDRVTQRAEGGFVAIIESLVTKNLFAAAADMKVLPLIVFSIAFGAALTTIPKVGDHVITFFNGVNEAMMKLVIWLMYFAPIGIFALVAARLGQAEAEGGFWNQVTGIGMHVVTVLTGLGIHFVVLVVILHFVAGRGLPYLMKMGRALLTAFGTASSSATLPITMESAREAGLDPRATRFVIPLGSTVNMNGTALYEACAAMFIAQAYGIQLGMEGQIIIFITATLAAIGAAGIPEAGLVTMVIVLNAAGLPTEGIALLLTVDWFLDRFRTSVNVWGDAVGAAVVDRHLPDIGIETDEEDSMNKRGIV